MFSATKFVVAGAIVALFGGFLLSGVLMQPSDNTTPAVGASASASAQVDPTAEATVAAEPSPEAEADQQADSAVRSDLLPGVDLKVEEVSPGVFRVLGDGERGLRKNVWDVAVTADGDVWVERHGRESYPGRDGDGYIRTVDSRVFQLGRSDTYELNKDTDDGDDDEDVELSLNRADGTIRVSSPHSRKFDGERWVPWRSTSRDTCTGFIAADGSCWFQFPAPGLARSGPPGVGGGDTYSHPEMGFIEPWPQEFTLARSDDGTIWAAAGIPGTPEFQLSRFDGQRWARTPAMDPVPDLPLADIRGEPEYLAVAGGSGQTIWATHWNRDLDRLHVWRWDGETWTAFGPIETSVGSAWPQSAAGAARSGLGEGHLASGIHADAGGSLWLDGLVRFERDGFTSYDVPASATNPLPKVAAASVAPDGSLWLVVVDGPPDDCRPRDRSKKRCLPNTDGLYVITPEAVASTE